MESAYKLIQTSEASNASENGFYKFLFSVVMPIFNSEDYLQEAIDSLIEQKLDFEENIQLILVDNASEDGSRDICLQYQKRYPNNIIYLSLGKNGGPSKARNAGIPYIKGKYINFMDSDDKWEKGAFTCVKDYLEVHPDISIAVCRMKYFDAQNEFHALDYRFKESEKRIVSIFNQPRDIQVHTNNVFFRVEAIKGMLYDTGMMHGEDAKFFTQAVLKNHRYALLRSAWYFYRKHRDYKSLLAQEQGKEAYFTDVYRQLLLEVRDCSLRIYNEVLPYVQMVMLYTIMNRIRDLQNAELSFSAQKKCERITAEYIAEIEDEFIGENVRLKREEKMLLFKLKYGGDISSQVVFRDKKVKFHNLNLFAADGKHVLKITNMDYWQNEVDSCEYIDISGKISLPVSSEKYRVVAVVNNQQEIQLEYYKLDDTSRNFFAGEVYREERGFKVRIPLNETERISFYLEANYQRLILPMNFQFVAKLTNHLQKSYCVLGNRIFFRNPQSTEILIHPFTKKEQRKKERSVLKELIRTKRIRTALWRVLIYIGSCMQKRSKKRLWLFMDYFTQGNDNAEALFRYVLAQKNPDIKAYFVISKDSKDYNRIKKYGKVIPYDTKWYRFMFAVCDAIITSQTFFSQRNTFYERTPALKDLFHFKYIYLQHGVIKDNHANTLAHYKTALDALITSAQPEFDSLMTPEYQLTSDIVKLTGLARYDELTRLKRTSNARKILLAPTWRRTQIGEWDESIQGYKYQDSFKDSEFYQFFNGIVTDPRILDALEKHDYEIEIQLHPRLWAQRFDFTESERVKIEGSKKSLVEEIQETALLITDYSSIAFDYAYVKIPIIYAQFDKVAFYSNHAYTRGYFDFEQDGFGPVRYEYESTVQAILETINNHCAIEKEYEDRIDSFFMYRDGKNCERIYNEILKLDGDA